MKAALAQVMFLMVALATPAAAQPAIEVLKVDPVELAPENDKALQEACRSWSLSKVQVEDFFRLAQEYAISPYASYYQTPCSITGELKSSGVVWRFWINGGATAVWTRGDVTRYWGCSQPDCAKLVLLPTDFMSGD